MLGNFSWAILSPINKACYGVLTGVEALKKLGINLNIILHSPYINKFIKFDNYLLNGYLDIIILIYWLIVLIKIRYYIKYFLL